MASSAETETANKSPPDILLFHPHEQNLRALETSFELSVSERAPDFFSIFPQKPRDKCDVGTKKPFGPTSHGFQESLDGSCTGEMTRHELASSPYGNIDVLLSSETGDAFVCDKKRRERSDCVTNGVDHVLLGFAGVDFAGDNERHVWGGTAHALILSFDRRHPPG